MKIRTHQVEANLAGIFSNLFFYMKLSTIKSERSTRETIQAS